MSALLQVEAVSKSFGSTVALRGVTFSCDKGEIHGLVGENGAGKSTLLKILAGVFPPDRGEIRLDDQAIHDFRPGAAIQQGIAIIYQEFSLIPALTVAENIFVGREPEANFGRLNRNAMRDEARTLLARLNLSVDPDSNIATLTVAEQQVVEIARALAIKAKLLILDEPTAALADREARQLLDILREARETGTSVIFVSHRLHEVLEIADVITVLKDGRVMATENAAAFNESRLISLMVGRELSHTFPARHAIPHETAILAAEHLTAQEGGFRDVNFHLSRGEILGIAGLEGHGQRELLRAIFGLEPLSSGVIRIGGKKLRHPSPARCIKHGMAFVSDDRKGEGLILPFDITCNISLTTLWQRQTLLFIHRQAERSVARDIVRRLQIEPPDLGRLVRYLSGGNQQKVVLGKWLTTQATVLLLDEPTRGIDVGTRVEIYALLRRLADDGMGILVVSRDMIELLGICNRILVVANGRTVAELDGMAATEEAIMQAIVTGTRRQAAGNPGRNSGRVENFDS